MKTCVFPRFSQTFVLGYPAWTCFIMYPYVHIHIHIHIYSILFYSILYTVYLSIYLSIYQSIYLSIYLSSYTVYIYIYVYIYIFFNSKVIYYGLTLGSTCAELGPANQFAYLEDLGGPLLGPIKIQSEVIDILALETDGIWTSRLPCYKYVQAPFASISSSLQSPHTTGTKARKDLEIA